jgi:hypothetical protein
LTARIHKPESGPCDFHGNRQDGCGPVYAVTKKWLFEIQNLGTFVTNTCKESIIYDEIWQRKNMKTIVLTCPKYEGSKMGWKEIKIEKYYLMCMEYISSCMVYNYLLKTVLGNIFVLRLFMYMHIYGLDNILL